jgi:protein TonB
VRDLEKLAIAAAASLVAHVAIGAALEQLPEQAIAASRPIHVSVVQPPQKPPDEPPPEPPKPKPPDPPKPPPKPLPKPTEHVQPHPATEQPQTPLPTPPSDRPPSPVDTGDQVYDGGSFSSSSGGGPAVAPGAGGGPAPAKGSGAPVHHDKPAAAAAIPDYEASTPAVPQGRCTGKYTEDALVAGVEGVVMLDIVVGESGAVSDITVTQRLGHGLDEAAVTALKGCRFTPAERDGKPVAVHIKAFKVRFVRPESP